VPQSAPGTIFGIPVSRLRDAGMQRMILFFGGIALVVSIVVPMSFSPFRMPVKDAFNWKGVIFPIVAGGAYLLVAAAPENIRKQIPPVVIQWIPFGISMWGIITYHEIILLNSSIIGVFGYVLLVFGLLSRISKPDDSTARVIMVIGAGLVAVWFLPHIGDFFKFSHVPILMIVYQLLYFAVLVSAIFCVLFVVPRNKMPPALQAMDSFGPLIAAILLVWLILGPILLLLVGVVHGGGGEGEGRDIVAAILNVARLLLYVIAFFGVLMMAAPNVYETLFSTPIQKRSQLGTLLFCMFIPLFIIYWLVETKEDFKKRSGLPLQSGWWLAVPIMNIIWLWKWAEGAEKSVGVPKMNAFLLTWLVAPAGVWVIQGKILEREGGAAPPMAQQQVGGGGYPPPGGGYPPPGGGYPPQGGGYPPQGGGYPPQQGGGGQPGWG
jgi:hypothetical protein